MFAAIFPGSDNQHFCFYMGSFDQPFDIGCFREKAGVPKTRSQVEKDGVPKLRCQVFLIF